MNSSFLKFVLMAVSAAFIGLNTNLNAADTTMDTNAAPGTDAAQATKGQPNNPPGPTAQGDTGTTGTPQQTKTGDTATTDKALSNGAPNMATKKTKHKKHHHSESEASQTNTAPATANP